VLLVHPQLAQKALPCTTPAYPYSEKGGFGNLQALFLEEPEDQLGQIYIRAAFFCGINISLIKACARSPRDQCTPFPDGTASGAIHTPASPLRPTLATGRLIFGGRRRRPSEQICLQSHSAG